MQKTTDDLDGSALTIEAQVLIRLYGIRVQEVFAGSGSLHSAIQT